MCRIYRDEGGKKREDDLEMKRYTRGYPVNHVNIRISNELYNLLHEACVEMGVTIQSAVTAFVLNALDSSKQCEDWKYIPEELQ